MMAALNKDESEVLRKTIRLIEEIQRHGYDPKLVEDRQDFSVGSMARTIARDLETQRRRLHTILTMKGYYPK